MARILVIEDNPDNRELMSYLLKAFGHEVVVAQDGEEGLAMARRGDAALIVCDVHLPRRDGYDIARTLKADAALAAIPLVAVTALAMVGDRDKLLAAGFDGYIAKPIEPQDFVRQIEALLPTGGDKPEAPAMMLADLPVATLPAAPAAVASSRARLLVVDDSPANRELTRAILEPFGYQLTVAPSAQRALELAAQQPFDMILSDLHMPLEDGLDLLRSVKADVRLRALPFLMLSSSAYAAQHRERALALGAAGFLLRPMEPQQLLEAVAACLARRSASPEDGG